MLTREGIVRLLRDAGVDVVAQAEDAEALLREVRKVRPDVAVVDIKMPPRTPTRAWSAGSFTPTSSWSMTSGCSRSAPSGFDELMPKTLATATVDNRLMHHAHICQTRGDSIWLTQALSGKGMIR